MVVHITIDLFCYILPDGEEDVIILLFPWISDLCRYVAMLF